MLSERQLVIFKMIVDEFISTAEPVGSKTLMNLLDVNYSSATIRNEMAALEDKGLLEKTHTSSGRIPSSKGYKFYVENLMDTHLDDDMENALSVIFDERSYSLDEMVVKSCEILSDMTKLTSVVLGPDSRSQTLQHVQLIPLNERSAVAVFVTNNGHTENKTFHFNQDISVRDIQTCTELLNSELCGTPLTGILNKMEELKPLLAANITRHEILFQAFVSAFIKFASGNVYFSGKSNMLYQPEFTDINKLKSLMSMLEDSTLWRELPNSSNPTAIKLANSELINIDDVAVVSSKFKILDGDEGHLMVVGPTRMPYNKVVALVEFMSKAIEDMFSNKY